MLLFFPLQSAKRMKNFILYTGIYHIVPYKYVFFYFFGGWGDGGFQREKKGREVLSRLWYFAKPYNSLDPPVCQSLLLFSLLMVDV